MASVPARISLVTLGVADVARATAFYESLGWRRSAASVPDVVSFFNTDGPVFGLFGRDALAADAGVPMDDSGFRATSLAINLDSPAEVDEAYDAWLAAGGRAVMSPTSASWDGYTAYVADPDDHLWEIAHNPGFTSAEIRVVRAPD